MHIHLFSDFILINVHIFTLVFLINTLKSNQIYPNTTTSSLHQSFHIVWIVFSFYFNHLFDWSYYIEGDGREKLALSYTLYIRVTHYMIFHRHWQFHTSCSSVCRLFQLLVLYISISSGWDCP